MVEKCGQKPLMSGTHTLYVEGFQAGGDVGMEVRYSGPDTGGNKVFIRSGVVHKSTSSDRYFIQCDPTVTNMDNMDSSQFTLCIFRSEIPLGKIPALGQADTGLNRLYFVGKGRLPVVDVRSVDQFRMSVPGTPDFQYAWAIYGVLQIILAGQYTLCISSDDG